MKRTLKKFIALIVVGMLLVTTLAVGIQAQASDAVTILTNSEQTPRYIPTCPVGNGKHYMQAHGFGQIREGTPSSYTIVLRNGATYQCTKCYHVVISQHNHTAGLLGTYGLDSPGYEVTDFTILYTSNVHYNSSLANDSTFDSYEWSLAP